MLLRRNKAALEKLQACHLSVSPHSQASSTSYPARVWSWQVNQSLRVQLLNTVRAEGDYVSSRVSIDKRQVEWLISPADRKALPIQVLRKLRLLEREETRAREQLPGSISKLIKGYELRMCRFEVRGQTSPSIVSCSPQVHQRHMWQIFECGRKLAVACLPVFFQPSGSASQLVFGLMVCFVAFGAYVHFDPYEDRGNDAVAALCQMQIFFSLLASVALTSASDATGTNMGVLLVVLYFLPVRPHSRGVAQSPGRHTVRATH